MTASTLNRVRSTSKVRAFVFAITVNWVLYYWTGRTARDGKLERSTHRADARKFRDAETALTVADTHDELRDSDRWKLVPMLETGNTRL